MLVVTAAIPLAEGMHRVIDQSIPTLLPRLGGSFKLQVNVTALLGSARPLVEVSLTSDLVSKSQPNFGSWNCPGGGWLLLAAVPGSAKVAAARAWSSSCFLLRILKPFFHISGLVWPQEHLRRLGLALLRAAFGKQLFLAHLFKLQLLLDFVEEAVFLRLLLFLVGFDPASRAICGSPFGQSNLDGSLLLLAG